MVWRMSYKPFYFWFASYASSFIHHEQWACCHALVRFNMFCRFFERKPLILSDTLSSKLYICIHFWLLWCCLCYRLKCASYCPSPNCHIVYYLASSGLKCININIYSSHRNRRQTWPRDEARDREPESVGEGWHNGSAVTAELLSSLLHAGHFRLYAWKPRK